LALYSEKRIKKGAVTGIILGFVVLHLITPLCFGITSFQYIYSRRTWGLERFKTSPSFD
jgi:hypothetical protein